MEAVARVTMDSKMTVSDCNCEAPAGSLAGTFFAGMVAGILLSFLAVAFLWKFKFSKKLSLFASDRRVVFAKDSSEIMNDPERGERGSKETPIKPSLKYDHICFEKDEVSVETYEALHSNYPKKDGLQTGSQQESLYDYNDPESVSSLINIRKSADCPPTRKSQKLEVKDTNVVTRDSGKRSASKNPSLQKSKISGRFESAVQSVIETPPEYFVLEKVENNEPGTEATIELNPPNEYFVLESQNNDCKGTEKININGETENKQQQLENSAQDEREVEGHASAPTEREAVCLKESERENQQAGVSGDIFPSSGQDIKHNVLYTQNGQKDFVEKQRAKFHRAHDRRMDVRKTKAKGPISNDDLSKQSEKKETRAAYREKKRAPNKGEIMVPQLQNDVQDNDDTHLPEREPTYANVCSTEKPITKENEKGLCSSGNSGDTEKSHNADRPGNPLDFKRSPTYQNVHN